jgi:hypothetical protein
MTRERKLKAYLIHNIDGTRRGIMAAYSKEQVRECVRVPLDEIDSSVGRQTDIDMALRAPGVLFVAPITLPGNQEPFWTPRTQHPEFPRWSGWAGLKQEGLLLSSASPRLMSAIQAPLNHETPELSGATRRDLERSAREGAATGVAIAAEHYRRPLMNLRVVADYTLPDDEIRVHPSALALLQEAFLEADTMARLRYD